MIREKTIKDPNGRGAKALKKRFRQIFDEDLCIGENKEKKNKESKKVEMETELNKADRKSVV